MVFGLGQHAGQALIDHPKVPLLSFTGGTVTGKKIAQAAATQYKKISLELGGKNPTIIFSDCDLEKAVATTVRSSFANQGEICLCGERLFVQRGIFDKFLEKFVAMTKSWEVGDPRDPSSTVGALISKQHLEKCLYYIDLAKKLGGKIECGGERVKLEGRCSNGFFLSPCILTNLSPSCAVNQEEIFGPVVCLIPFDTVSEVIQLANDIPYGLSASVFTESVSTANQVGMGLQVGTVWVNCWLNRDLRVPFGGVKQSGIGREGGKFSIDFYTEKKTICVQYASS
jgi:aminomuconate-semialdehyde/2-hydroxymuconate-6-semialdehyde dehydrogenase